MSRYVKLMIRRNAIPFWFLFLVLLFLSGFRWDVGIDWESYMNVFSGININERTEPANIIIKFLLFWNGYNDGGYWLWIMAFIILYFFCYSIWKLSDAPLFSLLLFICLGIFFNSLNGVRQHAAIALSVYSWQFILKRELGRFLLIIVLAMSFHMTAFLVLPLYWFGVCKFPRNLLIAICPIFILFSFVAEPVVRWLTTLIPQYTLYEESDYIMANSNILARLRSIFPLILFVFCICFYYRLSSSIKSRFILNLSLISIFCTLLFPSISLMIRIGYYFQVAFIFLIPMISKRLLFRDAVIFKFFCIIYGLSFLYFTQLSKSVAKIIPFQLDFRLANIDLLILLLITYMGILSFIFCIEFFSGKIK